MKKIIFVLSGITILGLSYAAIAQPGQYVRKQIKPDFFIPQGEMEKKEVLPPFYYEKPQPKAVRKKDDAVQEVSEVEEIATSEVTEVLVPKKINKPIDSEYINYNDKELESTPEYQQKYDDYIRDLQKIAKTGQYPENRTLNDELAKMNSNERVIVDDNFGIIPQPQITQEVEVLEVLSEPEEEALSEEAN